MYNRSSIYAELVRRWLQICFFPIPACCSTEAEKTNSNYKAYSWENLPHECPNRQGLEPYSNCDLDCSLGIGRGGEGRGEVPRPLSGRSGPRRTTRRHGRRHEVTRLPSKIILYFSPGKSCYGPNPWLLGYSWSKFLQV